MILVFLGYKDYERTEQVKRNFKERTINFLGIEYKERCTTCHKEIDISKSHPKEIGCTVCHRGNPYALDKTLAHKGLIAKPTYIPQVEKSCGRSGCHPKEVSMMKSSIMATQRGFVNSLRYHWGETNSFKEDFIVYKGIRRNSDAIVHYKKFCASCHLNKPMNIHAKDEVSLRGGGCLDCHLKKDKVHPKLTLNIDDEKCMKCHNRSIRIGLAYRGIYESIPYGTPYMDGGLSKNTLSSYRFYYKLPADVHYKKGLNCIDCHTIYGVMGDEKVHYHLENAIKISCEDCHSIKKLKFSSSIKDPIINKLLSLRENIPKVGKNSRVAIGSKGEVIYNLRLENNRLVFYKKNANKIFYPKVIDNDSIHNFSPHKRLRCEACHTKWVYQCYGCHIQYDLRQKQRDKLANIYTYGRFSERKSFYRFSEPMFGIGPDGKIWTIMPGCEVIRKTIYKNNRISLDDVHLDFVAISQHTISKDVPRCIECHLNLKRLGFGYGVFDGSRFVNILSGKKEPIWDNILSNKYRVKFARANARVLSKEEIYKILRAGYCAICHDRYDDKIYKNWKNSLNLFLKKRVSCKDF